MNAEERLLQSVIDGNKVAMRQLYDQFADYAMAVGMRYVPQQDDLKDILQDSFIKVFTSIGSFTYRGEGSLKSWIARIVVNECLSHLRKNKRFAFTDRVPEEADDNDPDVDKVSDETLMTLIGRLPDGYRIILNLFVFEQLSHKEIAQRLGITPSTSASQFHHAKKLLGRMIKEHIRNN